MSRTIDLYEEAIVQVVDDPTPETLHDVAQWWGLSIGRLAELVAAWCAVAGLENPLVLEPPAPLRKVQVRTRENPYQFIKRVEAYLWRGWKVFADSAPAGPAMLDDDGWYTLELEGHDDAGWTAEALVERLWSGLIAAEVVR